MGTNVQEYLPVVGVDTGASKSDSVIVGATRRAGIDGILQIQSPAQPQLSSQCSNEHKQVAL